MQKMMVVNKHFRLLEFMCHILFRLRFINAAGERRAKAMDNERQFWGTEFREWQDNYESEGIG